MKEFDTVKEFYKEHEYEILLMLRGACFGVGIGIIMAVLRHYGVSCF